MPEEAAVTTGAHLVEGTPKAWTIDFGSGFVLDQDLSQVTFTSADLPNSEAGVKYDAWVTATDDADVTPLTR